MKRLAVGFAAVVVLVGVGQVDGAITISHETVELTRQLQKSHEVILTKGGETRCFPV